AVTPAPEKTAGAALKSAPTSKPPATASTPTTALPTENKPPASPLTSASRSAGKSVTGSPEIVHQVIPDVSQKARSTIRGTVRINVRVELNPDGSVASADLDSPANSQFFADIALKAARDWRFAPASGSSAVVRFDFTNSGSNAYLVP